MSGIAKSPVTPSTSTPKSIVNFRSASGWDGVTMLLGIGAQFVSPAMAVANTLTPVLSVAGPGVISYLMLQTTNATARQYRVQLVLDGHVAFDSTSNPAQAQANKGIAVIGSAENLGVYDFTTEAIPFRSSCVLNVSSTIVEAAGSFLSEARYTTR